MGIISLVCGVLSMPCACFCNFLELPLSLAAIILGFLSLRGRVGKIMGIIGIVLGFLAILLWVVLLIISIATGDLERQMKMFEKMMK